MKILLLGPPASGKGTVGQELSQLLQIPLISVGQELRELPDEHPRKKEISELMNEGKPAPKDFLGEYLKERILCDDCSKGFIMDGWGRAMIDLKYFNPGFDMVIYLKISREVAIKRISGRRVCEPNGEILNIYTLPKEELDACPGPLIQRDDDKEEVVNYRYDLFENETMEVVEYFRKQGNLIEVDGEPTPEKVMENLMSKITLKND